MHRKLLVVLGAGLLVGCASMQPPKAPDTAYFCKPASAIRYRGEARPQAVSIRPASKYGSCK